MHFLLSALEIVLAEEAMTDTVVGQTLESLLRDLEDTKSILQSHHVPEETRQKLKKAAKDLLNNLEEPKDVILNYAYQVS